MIKNEANLKSSSPNNRRWRSWWRGSFSSSASLPGLVGFPLRHFLTQSLWNMKRISRGNRTTSSTFRAIWEFSKSRVPIIHELYEKVVWFFFIYRTFNKMTSFPWKLKDVRAHCYCASLVRTLFIRHMRATSFSSARTKSKTQQNIELTTFALTWCANIFVGCSVTPTFFRRITSVFDSLHYTKKQKKSVREKF